MEIIRETRKIGNSAGVLLPKDWLNAIVKVSIINSLIPNEIIKNIDLEKAEGVYLSGSYARDEQTTESDIDILVVTEDLKKSVKKGKYEITYIPEKDLTGMNVLIYYPMLIESKTIINKPLKNRLIIKLKEKLDRKYIETYIKKTNEILNLNEKEIKLSELKKEKYADNSIGYSLVLRLRTYYILDCIKKNKLWSKKEFLDIIKEITGSESAYQSYKDAKNRKKSKILSLDEARKMLVYLKEYGLKW
jgi:predicted nucleotidyltransferase